MSERAPRSGRKPPGFFAAAPLNRKPRNLVGELQDQGYAAFSAPERSHTDGKGSCQATLYYHTRGSGRAKHMPIVKSGDGHAEVQAVSEFVRQKCSYRLDLYAEYQAAGIGMKCQEKAVCRKCATFLGLMGIDHYDEHTTKCRDGMDMTQWEMPHDLRKFFLEYLQVRYPADAANITSELVHQFITTV